MDNTFWKSFEKRASESNLYHMAELAGLGILAAPSLAHMAGKPVKEKNLHRAEIAGLGILAAPSALHLAQKINFPKMMAKMPNIAKAII